MLARMEVALENLSRQDLIRRIQYLEAMVALFQRKKFGASSERFEGQTPLFNEPEASTSDQTPIGSTRIGEHKRRKGRRKPLPEHLPRIDKVYELTDKDCRCSCGGELKEFGEVCSEQLDIVPAKVRVIRHRRKKYSCNECQIVRTSALPPQPLPKTNASSGMLAYVATAKYVDALPLYRQEEIFRRLGIHMPRATLSRWMIDLASLLRPLYQSLEDELLASSMIHMDETTVQVIKESGKSVSSKKYMWLRCRSGPSPIVLFSYDPFRSAGVAKRLLSGYSGGLLTDGYEAYRSVVESSSELVHYGCWDHARRPFFDAVKARKSDLLAVAGLSYIQALYEVEKRYRDSTPAIRLRARRLYSASIIEHLHRWLERVQPTVLPKSPTGKALAYLRSQWDRLVRFLDNGEAPISNCFAENAIRPFVVGRKNWLFSHTPKGAQASATIYSIIETAKANGHEPYAYLSKVIEKMPAVETTECLNKLLPF